MNFEIVKEALKDLEEETLLSEMNALMEAGGEEAPLALAACQKGMEEVGRLFEEGEYFVGDLIFAGEIMSKAVEILRPALSAGESGAGGTVLLATVRGDLHDIGKNIVRSLLEAGGFTVVDMGTDVPAEAIVKTAVEENISLIALSGVLTLSLDAMADTVRAFERAGIRDKVRIVVGGAPINEYSGLATGADAWAQSPQRTLALCREWEKEKNL